MSFSTGRTNSHSNTVDCSTWSAGATQSRTFSELDHLFEETETASTSTADIDRELQELLAKEGDVKVDDFEQFVGARVPDGNVTSVRAMLQAQRVVVDELSHPPTKFNLEKEWAQQPKCDSVDIKFKSGVIRVHDKVKALKDQLMVNPTGHLVTDSETSFAFMLHGQSSSH